MQIRKVTKHAESVRITIPLEIGWKVGDNVKFEKIDEDTVIMKRIR